MDIKDIINEDIKLWEKIHNEEVIDKLERIVENGAKNGVDYRRIFPLLATLKAFESYNNQWGDIAVLHYGY